MQFSLM